MLAWILLIYCLNELDNIKILQVMGDSEASLLQRSLQGAVEGLCPAPFSYLTLFCPFVNEISGPKRVTHHIFYSVQKIAVVQRKKES